MHIEPGIVDGAKMVLAYGTGAASLGFAAKLTYDAIAKSGLAATVIRALLATALVFCFFELLPHYPVGVSEVHFIFGTTLFLLFGIGPAAVGLAAGLALQGLLLSPGDVPMYFVNITTLLVPLFAIAGLGSMIIPRDTAYKDLSFGQVLKLSAAFQGGVVAWVVFWALYGQGVGAENVNAVASFGVAYLLVILVEPVVDLAALAAAKALDGWRGNALYRLVVQDRVHAA